MLPAASTEAVCRLLQERGLAGEAAAAPLAPAAAPAALSRSSAALCFLTRDEAAALAALETLLLRQGGPSPPSCLRSALVRYKAEGRYQLARIDATLLRPSGQLALQLSGCPRLVPPAILSNANPLADGAAWQQQGQQELAALYSSLAGRLPTSGEVAAACCRLATARQWVQQLDSVAAALRRDPAAVARRLEDPAAIASLLQHIQPAEQPPAVLPQAAVVAPTASVAQPPSAGVPGCAAVQPTAPRPLPVVSGMPLAASAMTAAPPRGAAPGQQVPASTTDVIGVESSTVCIAGTAAAGGNLAAATRGSGMSRHWSSDEERRQQRGRQRRRRFSFKRGRSSSSSSGSSGSEGSRSLSRRRHTTAGQWSSSSSSGGSRSRNRSRSRRNRSSHGLGHSKGTKRSSRQHGKKSGRKHGGKKELGSSKKGGKHRKTMKRKHQRRSSGEGKAGRQEGKERQQEKRMRQEQGQREAEGRSKSKRRRSDADKGAAEQQELAGRSAADHSMRSAEEESLSEGELPRSPTVGQPRSQGMGGWGSQRGDKWRAEQRQEQRQTDKWLHDKWDRDEPTRRGAAAPAGEVQPASPSGKRRLRGRGRRRSGRGLEMDRVRPTAGSVQPSGGSEQRPLPPPAAEQPGEALGQHWQSPEERLAAEVAAEWRIKAQSPLWHREMEGDAPRGSGNEAVLLAAVAALEQAAPGGVHTALRFEERLSQLDSGWKRRLGGHSAAKLVWELNRRELVQAQVLAGPAGSLPTLAFRACSASLGGQQRRLEQL